MVRIACLHTAESNVTVFEGALRASGLSDVELRHAVRADLLRAAELAGCPTPEVLAASIAALRSLCLEADAVLLTCSTLGPAAEDAATGASKPIIRVDAALAAEAVRGGGTVVVLCAVATTMEPTRILFEAAARQTAAEVSVRLVPGAWDAYRAGDLKAYLGMVAQAAEAAMRPGRVRVALAQASMAASGALVPGPERPLDSPKAGLLAAVAAARSRQGSIDPGAALLS